MDDVVQHVWELFNTPVLEEESPFIEGAEIDNLNRLRYIIAIFAVYVAEPGEGERVYRKIRGIVKWNRSCFLLPLIEGRHEAFIRNLDGCAEHEG